LEISLPGQPKEVLAMKRLMLIAAVMIAATSVQAVCDTWHIRPDGTGDVPDIRTGILVASTHDILLLADGVYKGHGNTELSFGGKALVIRSESGDPHACVIDCEGDDMFWRRGFLFFSGEGHGSVLDGVTIRNGYGYEGSAIWCWASSPTVSNVIVRRNTAVLNGGGLYCGGGSHPIVKNVTFVGNSASQGAAIYCNGSSSASVEKSIVAFNRQGGAVAVTDPGGVPSFSCCDIYGNVGGDWSGQILAQYGVLGNISEDPLFCLNDNPDAPYSLNNSSPCAHACPGDPAFMGASGVGCGASVIEARVTLNPRVLNPVSQGRALTCYIELAEGYDPLDIDVSTVMLNGSVQAQSRPTEIGDHDENGIEDLMVKFARSEVLGTIEGVGDIEIVITGEVAGQAFAGTDTVRVLDVAAKRMGSSHNFGTDEIHFKPPIQDATVGSDVIIEFQLPEPCHVRLSIYDVQGRLVRRVVDETRSAGSHAVVWDAEDTSERRVRPGVYFVSLEAGEDHMTHKIVIVP
jgi:predicted outer membrane repeat protein